MLEPFFHQVDYVWHLYTNILVSLNEELPCLSSVSHYLTALKYRLKSKSSTPIYLLTIFVGIKRWQWMLSDQRMNFCLQSNTMYSDHIMHKHVPQRPYQFLYISVSQLVFPGTLGFHKKSLGVLQEAVINRLMHF